MLAETDKLVAVCHGDREPWWSVDYNWLIVLVLRAAVSSLAANDDEKEPMQDW